MAKSQEKNDAIKLRKSGKSIGEISNKLKISKSTASLWLRDVRLTNEQKNILRLNSIKAGNSGRMIGAQKNKDKKISIINRYKKAGTEQFAHMSKRDLTILATGLFWAEGGKTGSRFIFINSDPEMVKMMFDFLYHCWGIEKDRINVTIQINISHKPRIKKILIFWSNLLKLPSSQFNKPYYIKTVSNKFYDNHDRYFGTVRLSVKRSSEVLYRMLGLIDAVKLNKLSR